MYPESVPCLKTSKLRGGEIPCSGTATRLEKAPMELKNDRGPWYGCCKCGCVAQYKDFIEHQQCLGSSVGRATD
jgi:hypothetical protein